ncbi:MAG: TolC family protein, partial [Pseudohongiella sp.]
AAANAEVAATQAELDGVYVSLAAEVAARYIQLRGLQQRRSVAQRHSNNLMQSHELTVQLMNAGMGDALDVQRALTQLELVRARLPALDAQIEQTVRRLSVLTGQAPRTLVQQMSDVQPLPSIPPSIATGDPATLLQRRPDLRRAEHQLSADIARYQVSVSDLYPRISISGSIGFLATHFADLGSGGTLNYLFGPRVSWDAFDMGRVHNRIDAQDIRVRMGLARFEQTLLLALEDVENSISALGREGERQARLRSAAEASTHASNLAAERFEAGSDSFLDVLDAQRTQLEAEDLLTQSETDMALSVVSVYKALGGGWQQ